MLAQTKAVIADADAIYFVVDSRAGLLPADQAFAVDHAEAAEPAHLDGELDGCQRIRGMTDHRDLEPVGIELPGRRDVLRRPGAPRRHDGNVIEFVGAAGGSAHADLNHVAHI